MSYKICSECGITYRPAEVREICSECDGTGTSVFESDGICERCNGEGVVDEAIDHGMCEYCYMKMRDETREGNFVESMQHSMDALLEDMKIGGER